MYAWQKIYILSFIMSSHCNETAQQYNWKKMQTLLWLYSLNYHIYISATYNIHVRSTMGAKQVNKQKMKWVRLVKPTSTLTMTSLDQALYFSRPQCVCVCVWWQCRGYLRATMLAVQLQQFCNISSSQALKTKAWRNICASEINRGHVYMCSFDWLDESLRYLMSAEVPCYMKKKKRAWCWWLCMSFHFFLHDALKTKQCLITSFKAGSEMRSALCTDLHLCCVRCMRKLCQKYLELQREQLFLSCFGFARTFAAFISVKHRHTSEDLTTKIKALASRIWAQIWQGRKTCSLWCPELKKPKISCNSFQPKT